MSESDLISKENSVKCEDSNLSHASSDNLGTMPTFQTIEIVETQDNNSTEFVNESASLEDEDSNEGSRRSELETRSESEASQDAIESEEDSNPKPGLITNELNGNNEDEVQNQEDNDNATAQSWPTLEILPGGIIRPMDTEYPYCMYVDQSANPESDELMYACAKCPMRFKVLNSLTMHLRRHNEKNKEPGYDSYGKLKLIKYVKCFLFICICQDVTRHIVEINNNYAAFERKLLVLKRKRVSMESEHKKKKITVLSRIANAFATMDPDY